MLINVYLLTYLYSFSIAGGKGHTSSFVDGSDGVYISRLTEGGIAQRDGKIQVGDRIVAVCYVMDDTHY